MTIQTKIQFFFFALLLPILAIARNQAVLYETKGEALIYRDSTFKVGIERKNIPIPTLIDIRKSADFQDITSDSSSGWTKCRVPLKGEIGLTGITNRSLVFDCKPIR